MNIPHPIILRLPGVIQRSGLSRSSVYKAVAAKLWTSPIRLTGKSIGWPSSEIDSLICARIRGADDAEVRQLVAQLEAARQHAGIAAA